jgi:transposase
MSDNSQEQEFIQRILLDRDAEYRRANRAEQALGELSDVAALKDKYEREISEKDKLLAEKDVLLKEKDESLAKLAQRILYMERKLWGSMSEKRRVPDDPNQLKLDFALLEMTPEEEAETKKILDEIEKFRTIKVKAHEKKVPVRTHLPEGLRREEEHIYPDGYIGHEDEWILFEDTETSEHLEHVPAELYVRVTIRHKGMKKETKEIVTAPVPVEPIAKSYATSSLLTDIMTNKYELHLPFYRQIQMYKRIGMSIPQSTIESWYHEVADLMRPLYYRIREVVLSKDYIQSDETTVPIINNEKHRTVKGYLWLIKDPLGGEVFFHYDQGSRAQTVAFDLYSEYKGCIQTDGYAVYNLLAKLKGIVTMGCWAHCRRYFERAKTNDAARAEYALAQIGMLYDVENMANTDEDQSPEVRAVYRTRLAYPIIRSFEKWCIVEQKKVLPKSPIGKAIGYFLNFSRELARYVNDGRYKIDNNCIENSVRPVALGRKNYLFCGNHDAAEDAAVIYTMMGCCKAVGLDFKKWMKHFLDHVHDYDSDYSRDIYELSPKALSVSEKF